jgi:hypothetical protein
MTTITLTPIELEAVTAAIDETLIALESDEANFAEYETTDRYKALSSLYTRLLQKQLGV